MCNLYRMTKGTDEVARLFEAEPDFGANYGEEVYPGYPGLVVAEGRARAMTWGFPLVLTGKKGQKLKPRPVNNAREDKLAGSFWKPSFERRRCLIPVSAWAEAEGPKGGKTRTWYSLPGQETFAVAGLWRPTPEWGDAYSMVMVDASPLMADVHDRMPLLLSPEDRAAWLSDDNEAALEVCRPWPGDLRIERTSERWAGNPAASGQPKLL